MLMFNLAKEPGSCESIIIVCLLGRHSLKFYSLQKAWHPSTLSSKHYFNTYTKDFGSLMLNFAKQSEEIHGTANMDMKVMKLIVLFIFPNGCFCSYSCETL